MDDTTRAIIEKITIRYEHPITIAGKHTSNVFYNCLELSPNDLARLAATSTGHLPHNIFDMAVGLAYTGIFYAAAIAGGRGVGILKADGTLSGPEVGGRKVVIVDDVICTGARVRDAQERLEALGATVVGYACIIDRSSGALGSNDKALWSAFKTGLN